jgi:hypothetical protein
MAIGVGLGDTDNNVVKDSSFTALGEVRDLRVRAEMLYERLAIVAGRSEPLKP